MKLKHIAFSAAVAAALSGCVTMTLWEDNEGVEYKTVSHKAGEDKIHSFGVVGKDNSQLAQGSLVMMGEKYWFVVNPNDSAKLTEILNAKLPKQFQMVKSQYSQNETAYNALPVVLNSPESAEFTSELCLRYDAADEQEAAKLKALSFTVSKSISDKAYFRCVRASGKYYATPQNLPADYRFEQSVPVEISYTTTKERLKVLRLLGKTLLTPVALAADATVGLAFQPFYFQVRNIR